MSKTLREALDELAPLLSDAIADRLASLGIFVNEDAGWSWSCYCPLAVYLARETGCETAVVRTHAFHRGKDEKEYRLPPSVFELVLNIDTGKYPQLRKEPE